MKFYSAHLKLKTLHTKDVAGKICKLFRLSFCFIMRRNEPNNIVSYIEKSIKKGDVVFDIGSEDDGYLYMMRRRLGNSGRIISFESAPCLLQRLARRKKIPRWKNVELEPVILSDISCTKTVHKSAETNFSNSSPGAIIININETGKSCVGNQVYIDTLDNYCQKNNIRPSFLKIDAGGNELKILKGAINTLKADKPRILLKSEERLAGATNVLETFKYLHQLNYSGYFVLDTIRIPIVNFDFNLYQNTHNNFYCNNFIFE